ncbi:MAG: hypothetical protein ACRC7R_11825, partial [Sarcina sp.]
MNITNEQNVNSINYSNEIKVLNTSSNSSNHVLIGIDSENIYSFQIYAPYKAKYPLTLYYYSTALSFINVDINYKTKHEGYPLPSSFLQDASNQKADIYITLEAGISTIDIYAVTDESGDTSKDLPVVKIFSQVLGRPIAIPYLPSSNYYDISMGTLENGSSIDSSSKFVTNLGGAKDGSSEIVIITPLKGLYNLAIRYLSPNENTILKLDITDATDLSAIFSQSYTFPQIPGTTYWNAQVFLIHVNLNAGENILKFHGDGTHNAPQLGVLNILPYNEYYATNGFISNEARINETYNSVGYLGGKTDGSCILTVTVPYSSIYNISFKYLLGDGNRPLVIDINNSTSYTYTFPKTKGWLIDDIEIFVVQLILQKGINVIKLHGDGSSYAPDIFNFIILPYNEYSCNYSTFFNGAIIDKKTNFVKNIAYTSSSSSNTSSPGFINIPIITKTSGLFNLAIKYL